MTHYRRDWIKESTIKIADYHRKVHVPAYTTVAAMQRNGLPVSEKRAVDQLEAWEKELSKLQAYVEGEAAKKGFIFQYSPRHSPKPDAVFRDFLYSPTGLGLEITKWTEKGEKPSTDDEALLPYAAVGPNHWGEDHPVVYSVLKIRSIAKAAGTHLSNLLSWRREDGACHPKYWWDKENTTRLSAEDPPVHQLPERANPEVAKLVKACIVPRVKPWMGSPDGWDPRKHGWVAKVDVQGAEAVVRAGCIARCRVSAPYLREGKDIHSKTASILYRVSEGTYGKGTVERERVGKTSYFLLIFGGSWKALQRALWLEARIWQEDKEAVGLHGNFFVGYPDLQMRYGVDTELMFKQKYVEDAYGRRWQLGPPPGVRMLKSSKGITFEFPPGLSKERRGLLWSMLENRRHIYANRPTQAAQATTTLWCIALCYHGEYVELREPEYWGGGSIFPEVEHVRLDGKTCLVWLSNTVHDALWMDGAPGTLETAAKVVTRRFNGVPADFLLEANQPWRIGITAGPDLGTQWDYNVIAEKFGLEPLPMR